jgi:hypothetical protein
VSERLEYLRALGARPPAGEAAILAELAELAGEVDGRMLDREEPSVPSWWSCPSCGARNSLREPVCRFCGNRYRDEYRVGAR